MHDCGCALKFGKAGIFGKYMNCPAGKDREAWEIAKTVDGCIVNSGVVKTTVCSIV